jgi:hypothetical protein
MTTTTTTTTITTNNKMKSTLLEEKLNAVKLAFEFPRSYLSDFFIDLRAKIDLAFVKKRFILKEQLEKSIKLVDVTNFDEIYNEKTQELNDNWIKMIDKVNEFEAFVFKVRTTNKLTFELTNQIAEQIKQISKKINDFTHLGEGYDDESLFNEINLQIYDNLFQIEKYLFRNQCIYFVDREKCESNKYGRMLIGLDYKTTAGKLVIVTNEYFSTNTLDMLTK